ncbi:MAG: zinc-dependent peptidase [Desulfuromonas sp.]|nr:zinc-dependent peptidase [Desulfuromonas sp.]
MGLLRRWHLHRLHRQPFPTAWRQILDENVPLCRSLPEQLRAVFEKHVRVFLDEKYFEGCGGLEVTDEMRLTVAGYACLLLLHDPDGYYPRLGTVVIYPESFAAPIRATDQSGIVTETVEERLGESWEEGTVVLAWDSIREIIRGVSGDCNVIVHEFAHQIDAQQGLTEGRRLLAPDRRFDGWEELLEHEQRRQRTARRRGPPSILDPYAYTSPEELFAVATETFFMRPLRFKANHEDLYRELQTVYGVDPAEWLVKTTVE